MELLWKVKLGLVCTLRASLELVSVQPTSMRLGLHLSTLRQRVHVVCLAGHFTAVSTSIGTANVVQTQECERSDVVGS